MLYLLGSIILSAAGFFINASIYGAENLNFVYVLGTFAYIVYMIGFLLLEYAVHYFSFSTVFSVWSAGMAVLLTFAGILFWGESISTAKSISIVAVIAGSIGLFINTRSSAKSRR